MFTVKNRGFELGTTVQGGEEAYETIVGYAALRSLSEGLTNVYSALGIMSVRTLTNMMTTVNRSPSKETRELLEAMKGWMVAARAEQVKRQRQEEEDMRTIAEMEKIADGEARLKDQQAEAEARRSPWRQWNDAEDRME